MGFHDFDVMLTKQFISRLTFQKRNHTRPRPPIGSVRRAASIHAQDGGGSERAKAKFLKMRTVVRSGQEGREFGPPTFYLFSHAHLTARQAPSPPYLSLSSLSENALILSPSSGIIK